tara:strand:- start:15 stop:809 length:795 start_codon:yes stop_codon:yes gene_type:complete
MKKLILLLLFFISFNSYSQKYYDENDFDKYIDYDNKIVKLQFKDYLIEGGFEKVETKTFDEYLVVKGNGNEHYVLDAEYSSFKGLDVLDGNYSDVLKEVKKGKKYKKVKLLFSYLRPSSYSEDLKLISDSIMKMRLESQKKKEKEKAAKEEFKKTIIESGYVGTYDIKIYSHRGVNYSNLDYNGKIIITDVGITIETDIPTVKLVRGTYNIKGSDEVNKGIFVCDISVGYDDFFTLIIKKDSDVGSFTSMSLGSSATTTTFSIK